MIYDPDLQSDPAQPFVQSPLFKAVTGAMLLMIAVLVAIVLPVRR